MHWSTYVPWSLTVVSWIVTFAVTYLVNRRLDNVREARAVFEGVSSQIETLDYLLDRIDASFSANETIEQRRESWGRFEAIQQKYIGDRPALEMKLEKHFGPDIRKHVLAILDHRSSYKRLEQETGNEPRGLGVSIVDYYENWHGYGADPRRPENANRIKMLMRIEPEIGRAQFDEALKEWKKWNEDETESDPATNKKPSAKSEAEDLFA